MQARAPRAAPNHARTRRARRVERPPVARVHVHLVQARLDCADHRRYDVPHSRVLSLGFGETERVERGLDGEGVVVHHTTLHLPIPSLLTKASRARSIHQAAGRTLPPAAGRAVGQGNAAHRRSRPRNHSTSTPGGLEYRAGRRRQAP